ncbi:MAG: 3-isopropylmalate dehydrogenase [Acidimicrobiia bacterium]
MRPARSSGSDVSNHAAVRTYRVAMIPGDGTGPEVLVEGRKVLEAAARRGGFQLDWYPYDLGGARYLKTGETLPDSVLKELREVQAIYLGAIGHPGVKPGVLEQGILLKLRFELDQYINLRPVKLYPGVWTPLRDKTPEQIDFVVVRENTEGLYAGVGGFLRKGTPDEVALQTSVNTRHGVERCIRFAFEFTRKRAKARKLTLCGKTNVLTYAHDLWQRVFDEVAAEYPGIQTDYTHVDACCMWMVKNPEWFDVIVTDNMFGDIITDLGAAIQGGLGIASGANINPNGVSMFEPIGGTAPGFEGTGLINPLAAIGAAGMMLDVLGERPAAAAIETAVGEVAGSLPSLRAGEMGMSTSEVGDRVVALVAEPETAGASR